MFEFLNKLPFSRGVQIAIMIFGNIIAPYWFLFHFIKPLVANNNIIQQLIFCLAIAIPVTILNLLFEINTLYNKLSSEEKKQSNKIDEVQLDEPLRLKREEIKKQIVFQALRAASISTALIFYIPCIMSFFFYSDKRQAIIWCISCFVGVMCTHIFPNKRKSI